MKTRLSVVVAVVVLVTAACGGGGKSGSDAIASVPVSDVRVVSTSGSDVLLGVTLSGDGGLLLSGHTDGVLEGDGPSPTGQDALVVHYDTSLAPGEGDPILGFSQLGTDLDDAFLGITSDGEGGAVAVGYSKGDFATPAAGINDMIAVAVDASGAQKWRAQAGGPDWDRGYSAAVGADGAVYIGGYTFGGMAERYGGAGAGGHDAAIARIAPIDGNEFVVSVGSDGLDWGQSMAVDSRGGIVVVGYTQGSWGRANVGGRDAFVTRLDADGTVDWTVQFGSDLDDWLQGVTVLTDGTIVGVGFTAGAIGDAIGGTDILVVRVSPDGELLSTMQTGTTGDDRAFGAAELADGTVVISGSVSGDFAGAGSWAGKKDPFVAGLDDNGTIDWVSQFGSEADDDGYGIAVLGTSVWFVGVTAGAITAAPLAGPTDAWVARIDVP